MCYRRSRHTPAWEKDGRQHVSIPTPEKRHPTRKRSTSRSTSTWGSKGLHTSYKDPSLGHGVTTWQHSPSEDQYVVHPQTARRPHTPRTSTSKGASAYHTPSRRAHAIVGGAIGEPLDGGHNGSGSLATSSTWEGMGRSPALSSPAPHVSSSIENCVPLASLEHFGKNDGQGYKRRQPNSSRNSSVHRKQRSTTMALSGNNVDDEMFSRNVSYSIPDDVVDFIAKNRLHPAAGSGSVRLPPIKSRSVNVSYLLWPSRIQCGQLFLEANIVDSCVLATRGANGNGDPSGIPMNMTQPMGSNPISKQYAADYVFSSITELSDLTDVFTKPIAQRAINGQNSCFIMCGPTRSDELFVLAEDGLFELVVNHILSEARSLQMGNALKMSVSAAVIPDEEELDLCDILTTNVQTHKSLDELYSELIQTPEAGAELSSRLLGSRHATTMWAQHFILVLNVDIRGVLGKVAFVDLNMSRKSNVLPVTNLLSSIAQSMVQPHTTHVSFRVSRLCSLLEPFCGHIDFLCRLSVECTESDARSMLEMASHVYYSKTVCGSLSNRDYREVALELQRKLENVASKVRDGSSELQQEVRALRTENYFLRTTLTARCGDQFTVDIGAQSRRVTMAEVNATQAARRIVSVLMERSVIKPPPSYLGDTLQTVCCLLQLLHQVAERESIIEAQIRQMFKLGYDRGTVYGSDISTIHFTLWSVVLNEVKERARTLEHSSAVLMASRGKLNMFSICDDATKMLEKWNEVYTVRESHFDGMKDMIGYSEEYDDLTPAQARLEHLSAKLRQFSETE